ncbi:MAG: hypothetical protein WAM14_16235 [Candidatus Nitrosopolaris sp.]
MMRHPLYGPPLGNVKSEQNILQSEENIVKAEGDTKEFTPMGKLIEKGSYVPGFVVTVSGKSRCP